MCSEATEWGLWPHLHTVETVYLFPDFFTSLWICLVLTTGCSPEYLYYHDDVDQVSLLRQQLVSDLAAFFKIVVAQSCFKQPLFAPARVSRAAPDLASRHR